MRFGKLGKRNYAFNLTWDELYERQPATQVRASLDDDSRAVYARLKGDGERAVVGWAQVSTREPMPRGRVYSYAAALAAAGVSGIFVAPVDDESIWYVAVADGLVVPNTDLTVPSEAALSKVFSMRAGMGLDIHVAEGFDLGPAFEDAVTFDVEGIVAKVKVAALKRVGQSGSGANPLLIGAFVCGVAAMGWYFMQHRLPAGNAVSPAEQAVADRSAYLTAMRGVVALHPKDSEWIVRAFNSARKTLPVVIGGWRLEGANCTLQGCVASYSSPMGEPRMLAPVIDRFGSHAVLLLPDQNSLTVRLPGPAVSVSQWNDDQILAPLPWPRLATDVSGRVGLNFAGVEIDGPVVVDEVGATNMPPPDALPFIRERISIKQAQALDETRLGGLVAHFAADGFVATTLAFSSGAGIAPSGWRLEFDRLGGR